MIMYCERRLYRPDTRSMALWYHSSTFFRIRSASPPAASIRASSVRCISWLLLRSGLVPIARRRSPTGACAPLATGPDASVLVLGVGTAVAAGVPGADGNTKAGTGECVPGATGGSAVRPADGV